MKPMNDLLTRQVKWLAVALIAAAGTAYDAAPAKAGKGGAFLGGILAGHVVGGFVRRDRARTQAEMYQAYRPPPAQPQAAPPPQRAAAPAPAAGQSVEQRIKELEGLASKGIISKQEYQARRKAILDGI
jgi:hypothetical protein